MNDEPTQNSNAKVNLASKPGFTSVHIDNTEPAIDLRDTGENTTIAFVICAAVVACVFIVSVATYEIANCNRTTTRKL